MANTPLSDARNLKRQYFYDLGERAAWTWLQTFGAVLVASGWFSVDQVTDLSILQKAAIAGIGAVLSLVKGLVATQVGSPNTAATLPVQDDTPKAV